MWAGFLDVCVIGPYFLPPNLTGDAYLNFLELVLHGLFEDMPLHVHQNCAFSMMMHHLILLVQFEVIWIDKLWWLGCLTCTFTRPDSARLLPVGPHEELGLKDPCRMRGRPAGTDLCLQQILDYKILVIVCTRIWYIGTVYMFKLLVATLSPSYKWTQKKNNVQ